MDEATPTENLIALPSGTVVGSYQIGKLLGSGGFGLTYVARHERLGRLVAVKELLPFQIATRAAGGTVVPQTAGHEEDYRWAVHRFEAEARNLARLKHPNVVEVVDILDENNTAYLVMEFVEGVSLEAEILAKGPLPEARVREILRGLGDGLEHAHNRDLLHRTPTDPGPSAGREPRG